MKTLKSFRLSFANGQYTQIVYAYSALELVKKYDLASKRHVDTRITELQGEQHSIAIDNITDDFGEIMPEFINQKLICP